MRKSENEWKMRLSSRQFYVLRCRGTEPPFSGKYLRNKEKGVYHCAGCDAPLFSSEAKFNSGTGWPSFTEPIDKTSIEEEIDTSFGMIRTEVHCINLLP
ncbi:MAG: peptide-methionine (R)-S-oxide reductase MsrB [Candidatus Helarchaeota archaeon]